MLLNNSNDRETTGFQSATDYVKAIVDACHSSIQADRQQSSTPIWSDYITHLVYLRDCSIPVNVMELRERGVECVGILPAAGKKMVYDPSVLERVLNGICSGRGSGLQRRATIQNWSIS